MKEITEDRWEYMLEVLPPMYLLEIDGKKVKGGFAVSEALSHGPDGGPTFSAYWQEGEKFYEQEVSVIRPTGKNVGWNYTAYAYEKFVATSVKKPEKTIMNG